MSKKIDDFKKQYENIKATEELIMKANKEIKKSKAKRGFAAVAGSAAAFVIAFGVAANASPTFAYAMSDVPGTERNSKSCNYGKI